MSNDRTGWATLMVSGAGETISDLLARLEDVVEPAPVSWGPQTVAWWILGAVLFGLGIGLTLWVIRRWRSNRYRREALFELGVVEKRLRAGDVRAIASVAIVLRRVALHIAPREHVASLTGEAWLGFLDDHVRHSLFATAAARQLIDVAYAPPAAEKEGEADRAELLECAQSWVRRHHA